MEHWRSVGVSVSGPLTENRVGSGLIAQWETKGKDLMWLVMLIFVISSLPAFAAKLYLAL